MIPLFMYFSYETHELARIHHTAVSSDQRHYIVSFFKQIQIVIVTIKCPRWLLRNVYRFAIFIAIYF